MPFRTARAAAAFFATHGPKIGRLGGRVVGFKPSDLLKRVKNVRFQRFVRKHHGKILATEILGSAGATFGLAGLEAKQVKRRDRERAEAVQKFKSSFPTGYPVKPPARRKKVPRTKG